MRISKFVLLFSLLLAFTVQANQGNQVDSLVTLPKPSMSVSKSVEVTAKVKEINHETRQVTLVSKEGKDITFTVSDEARNLKQVAVGDLVTAKYVRSLSVQVMAADGIEPSVAGIVAKARADEGQMPAAAAIQTQVNVLTVEAVNIEANTFKLKDADGVVTEYTARNPENLKRSEVGDVVVVTKSQSVAVSVVDASVEK